jgi:hypothetical protein
MAFGYHIGSRSFASENWDEERKGDLLHLRSREAGCVTNCKDLIGAISHGFSSLCVLERLLRSCESESGELWKRRSDVDEGRWKYVEEVY